MYTDTTCPNHLIQVLDNSVDEALAGYCKRIKVNLYKNGIIEVADNGRGMPVDIHPDHQLISGVELILCKLHAGLNFQEKIMDFQEGCMEWGVSVVNALSAELNVIIKGMPRSMRLDFVMVKKFKNLKK